MLSIECDYIRKLLVSVFKCTQLHIKVHNRFERFKNGREDMSDDKRTNRPEGNNRAVLVQRVN